MKWRRVEARLYPLADACVAVTIEDAEAISRRWGGADRSRIHVIPNGVEVTHFAPWPVPEVPNRILITGNMHSPDTLVSLRWFLHSVLPRIRRRVAMSSVEIVGRDPLPSLRAVAAGVPGVELLGYVPDLRPHLARASVYVAPLLLGSGIKNRVLEALAMGKPVVATPLGIQGLEVKPGRDVLTATTADEFADSVGELLQDGARRIRLGQSARDVIAKRYSWVAVCDRVEDMLSDLRRSGTEHSTRQISDGIPEPTPPT